MPARLITLQQWARNTYGESAPCMTTLRRWARDDRIDPPAEKHGREYFVPPDARYATAKREDSNKSPKTTRMAQSNRETATQMIERMISGGRKTQAA